MVDEYNLVNAFYRIEEELIDSMVRNLKRHRAQEDEEGLNWSMWQVEQLKALEKYSRANRKKYGGQFRELNRQIEALIRQAKDAGGMEQEMQILRAIKNGFQGIRRGGDALSGEFFRLNEHKLEALIEATTHDMGKAETAVLRMADDQYRKIIFNAQVYANTGAGTYEKAVDMAARDFLAAGLNCVEYKNGARHTLPDYADMAIRTASKRAYLAGEGEVRKGYGISTVIMNKRGNPCPKCLPFCGKVLIDDVWSGGSRRDGNYPLMSTAIAYGLYHPRCKDVHTTYFPGISTADDTWTKEELEAIQRKGKLEAEQQYARRQEEKYSRLARHSLDGEDKKEYKKKIFEWGKRKKKASQESQEILLPHHEKVLKDFQADLEVLQDKDVRALLLQAQERTKFKASHRRNSYFSSKDYTIYIADSAKPSTIAHELFHEIDHMYGISESGRLTHPIQADYGRLDNFAKVHSVTFESMIYSNYPELFIEDDLGSLSFVEKCRGISDILNGMSGGELFLGYGHLQSGYWKRPLKVEKETWAQYGRMLYDGDEEVLYASRELFPLTTREINRILEELIK